MLQVSMYQPWTIFENVAHFSHEDLSSFEDRIAAPKQSLREHLIDQILLDIPKGIERKIAMLFLDVIEPSGWININLEDFCNIHNLNNC